LPRISQNAQLCVSLVEHRTFGASNSRDTVIDFFLKMYGRENSSMIFLRLLRAHGWNVPWIQLVHLSLLSFI